MGEVMLGGVWKLHRFIDCFCYLVVWLELGHRSNMLMFNDLQI